MKRLFYLNTLMFCSLFFTSCHKDDTMELPNSDQATRDSIERVYKHKERCVLTTLCDVEELPGGSCQYTPTYGKVLYSATPTVRYKVVKDLKEAKFVFNSMLTMALDSAETVDMNPDDITYHIESRGSIRFSASSDAKTQIARVTVDFPIVPDLKEIVFIPKERWPHNDISMLRYGAVYEDPKTHFRFVCIADTESGDGTLITFDGNKSYEKDENKSNDETTYENWTSYVNWGRVQRKAFTRICYKTELDGSIHKVRMKQYYNMSSQDDLSKLREFMYYTDEHGRRYKNEIAELIFEKGVGGYRGLYPFLYPNPNPTWPWQQYSTFLMGSSGSVSWDWKYDGWRRWYFYIDMYFYYLDVNNALTNRSIKFRDKAYWTTADYIHSLSVTVDETFDPEEYLTLIYPKRNPKNR